jgi:hypothetical protein
MTRPGDRYADMLSGTRIDAAIDQALNDATVPDDVAPFAGFVDNLRVMADRPVPQPSAELAALLAGRHAAEPDAGATVTSLQPRRRRVQARTAIRTRVAAMGLAGRAAMVAAFAATAVAGAAAGILPEPATRLVRRAIEVVTPFELPATERDAPSEDTTEARAAGEPGHTSPVAVAQPTPDGDPLPDTTAPADPGSATATGDSVARSAEPGAPTPRGDSYTVAPTAPDPSDDPANGQSPDHEPAPGPAPTKGHVPPGQASPGAPHPDGGRPGDAPPAGSDPDPEPLSSPKGFPPKRESPGGPRQAPDRRGAHHGGRGSGPGPDTGGQAPTEPQSDVPSEPQPDAPGRPDRHHPSPGGGPGRTGGQQHRDPAPPAADGRGASQRTGPGAPGGAAPQRADGRSTSDTGSAPAADAPSPAPPSPSA